MFRSLITVVVVSAAAGGVIGCSSLGFTSNPSTLKSQVAFDHECTADKVNIVDSAELGQGHASFKVEACGQNYRYERLGTSYFDTAKGSPVDQAMGKAPSTQTTQTTSATATRP